MATINRVLNNHRFSGFEILIHLRIAAINQVLTSVISISNITRDKFSSEVDEDDAESIVV